MNYSETARWLCSLRNGGAKFGIDRMGLLAGALGHPEHAFPSILIAGSNGKGSTAAMLEALYRAHGLKTGLYTSPHLIRLGERVQINRVPLDEAAICEYTETLAVTAREIAASDPDNHPSFFEFMTAMAFLEFHRKAVDIGIIEVGLGGRLDATNILQPRLSVITSISLEHTDLLGDTLEKIAFEKGGIIKPRTPVALGWMSDIAEHILREIARERQAPVFSVRERFENDPARFPSTNLAGQHQRANAALALLCGEILQPYFPVPNDTALASLQNVAWSARWQQFALSHDRRLIIDVAHNAEGAGVIDPLLAQLAHDTGRAPLVITGILGLERARPLLAVLARHARDLHLVRPAQERACDFAQLESCIPPDFSGAVVRATLDTLFPTSGECALGDPGDTIVVAGSVYLAGEVLGRFLPGGAVVETGLQDALPVQPVTPDRNLPR